MWRNWPDFRAEQNGKILSRLWLSWFFSRCRDIPSSTPPPICKHHLLLGPKGRRTKSLRIFRISDPNFAPNFPQIFPEFFVLCFQGNGDHKTIHQKSPPFFNANSPGKVKEKIHKSFPESRQANLLKTIVKVW